jgi:hypothetical protein
MNAEMKNMFNRRGKAVAQKLSKFTGPSPWEERAASQEQRVVSKEKPVDSESSDVGKL